jgi:hypothetical protein
MTVVRTAPGQQLVSAAADDEVVTGSIPVDLPSNTGRMLMRIVVDPTIPGDVLDVEARARVTNDVGYNIGVGWHLWRYDVDDGQPWPHSPWVQIGPLNGDNVDPQRHHMPLHTSAVYRVPDSWPAGHRMVVLLQADAHSTAWQSGDTLTVDQAYGLLKVRRWTTP